MEWTAEQVKEHDEAIFVEKDRAIAMADRERELAAAALRDEQHRREDQAGRERDKAADNLKTELARAIAEGDERLREHIQQQFQQIQAALASAELLEQERLARADARITAIEDKQAAIHHASEVAQDKFEEDVKLRFQQVNEFRGSLDDLSKQMATRRELETAIKALNDAVENARRERQHQIDELRTTLSEMRSRLDVGAPQIPELQRFVASTQGRREGVEVSSGMVFATLSAVIAVISIVVVLTNVFTS